MSQTLDRKSLTITQSFVVLKCLKYLSIFDAGTSTKLHDSFNRDGKENSLAMLYAVSQMLTVLMGSAVTFCLESHPVRREVLTQSSSQMARPASSFMARQ